METDRHENNFIGLSAIPAYPTAAQPLKYPAMELLDYDFHYAVTEADSEPNFPLWSAECYFGIVCYRSATTEEAKRDAAIRVAQSVWEAAESDLSVGAWLIAVASNWAGGVKDGRAPFGWLTMQWDHEMEAKYIAKTLRHFSLAETAPSLEIKTKHLAALFCNANILWRRCSDIQQ